jgi:hypothetical protein
MTIHHPNPGGAATLAALGVDAPPSPPHADDQEFASGDAMAWVNQDSATVSYEKHNLIITAPAGDTSLHGRTVPITSPSGNYRYQAKIQGNSPIATTNLAVALLLRESGTGKLGGIFHFANNGGIQMARWTDPDTFGASHVTVTPGAIITFAEPWILEVERSGSNILYRYLGPMGGPGILLISLAITTPFTTQPDEIGIFVRPTASVAAVGVCSWLRRVA